ncbi:uncharacterized protein [Lepisosteus oculatus]|uniref:uncharacterized protein n=1 Tax=Lepisosteus oculatus TaxID=7918 RepID=UPI003722AB98
MEPFLPATERYLMKLTFDTKINSPGTDLPGALPPARAGERAALLVRVSSAEPRPLTGDQLRSLALSLPALHRGLTAGAAPRRAPLLHAGTLRLRPLPLPGRRPPGASEGAPVPGVSGEGGARFPGRWRRLPLSFGPSHPVRFSLSAPGMAGYEGAPGEGAPREGEEEEEEGEDPHPSLGGILDEEWVSVQYGGREFLRVFSPVGYAEEEEVLGRWAVSDYTAYGQLAFSLIADFLRTPPRGGASAENRPPAPGSRAERKRKAGGDGQAEGSRVTQPMWL